MVVIGNDGEVKKAGGSIEEILSGAAKMIAMTYSYLMESDSVSEGLKGQMIDALTEAILKTVIEMCGDEEITGSIIRACKTVGESNGEVLDEFTTRYKITEGGMTS